jgi:hypothetical protein
MSPGSFCWLRSKDHCVGIARHLPLRGAGVGTEDLVHLHLSYERIRRQVAVDRHLPARLVEEVLLYARGEVVPLNAALREGRLKGRHDVIRGRAETTHDALPGLRRAGAHVTNEGTHCWGCGPRT